MISIAIFFIAGTTKLQVVTSTLANSNEGLNSSTALPLNYKTSVRIEASGLQLRIFLNNTLDSFSTLSGTRYSGIATLYVSDPWYPAATAYLSSINMATLPYVNASSFTGSLKQFGVYDATVVPQNYSLSFDIIPTAISSNLTNLIHYTQDGTDNFATVGSPCRIPGKSLSSGRFIY